MADGNYQPKKATMQSLVISDARVISDAEVNQSGTIYRTTIAVDVFTGAKEGPKYETSFFTVKGFASRGGVQFLKKGAHINLKGELRQEKWTGADGSPRSAVTVWVDTFDIAKFADANNTAAPKKSIEEEDIPF